MSLSPTLQVIAGFASGMGGGVLSGLFGVGGGVILVPLLRLVLGMDQHQAQGVTLAALLLPSSLPAMIHYRRQGIPIHWPLVWALILSFLPGVWGGATLANLVPEGPLKVGFAIFLVVLALRTFMQKPAGPIASSLQEAQAQVWWPGLFIGFVGGLLSGLLGIGGGVVMIPLLALWLKLRQHEAQLTSLAVLLPPIGLPGLLVYARHQSAFPWLVLSGLAVGFVSGTYMGALMATKLSGANLRKAFAGLMCLTAGIMIWKG